MPPCGSVWSALSEASDVDLVGVWGRTRDKAETLASTLDVTAYDDYEALLEDVDAVAFAVPPDAQAQLALVAARAGKHLLLEKPVAMSVDDARALRDAASSSGVASVVFFTDRFIHQSRAWFREVHSSDGWGGGWLRWFSSLQETDNPFGSSPWRQQRGALWDVGPHALSTLGAALGTIDSVTAVGGNDDLVENATSTASITAFAPPAAQGFEAVVWGESGLLPMPPRPEGDISTPYATAVEELVAAASTGSAHHVDLAFGTHIVELLADAQTQLDAAHDTR